MSEQDLDNLEGMADFLCEKSHPTRGFNGVATRRSRVLSRQRAEATKQAKAGKSLRVSLAPLGSSDLTRVPKEG